MINEKRLLDIILAPHVTEKTTRLGEKFSSSQYVFKVRVNATKKEIFQAIQYLFKVKPISVRVVNMKAESCRVSGRSGKHKAWKKAYITLAEGDSIDLSSDLT